MSLENFLWMCKELYLKGIHPFDLGLVRMEFYQRMERFAKEQMERDGIQNFLGILVENQYRVNVWGAKLAMESGNPGVNEILKLSGKETIVSCCLEVIESHAKFDTNTEQHINAVNWIERMKTRYKQV